MKTRKTYTSWLLSVLLFSFFLNSFVYAQKSESKLIVGTKIAEPFSIEQNSEWSGISFELWKMIAKELGADYEVKKYDLDELLKAVSNSEVDVVVSPLTITAEREIQFDFTHSYYTTGLSVAVSKESNSSLVKTIFSLFTSKLVTIVLLIILVLFFVAFLVWLFEKDKNKTQFGDGAAKGLASSFWWAAVTMTTVGYGDKAPQTLGGRTIALIWMFAGLIMISGFTAAVASALTVDRLDVGINSVSDLHSVNVCTIKSSSSEEYLLESGIDYKTVKNINEGIDLVRNNKIDALIYDAPILKYHVKSKNITNEIKVLPIILDPINYAFALPTNSQLTEKINQILLRKINNVEWTKTINSYLGSK